MKVKVRFFAAYREILGQRETEVELPKGARVSLLLANLIKEWPALSEVAAMSRFVVNQEFVSPDTLLEEGDEVAFIPPVAGGSRFEITEDEITADELVREVVQPKDGAVVVFVGVVRDNSHGHKVRYLKYEAYKEMAEKKLAEIGEEIRQRWGLDEMAIRHRVGSLQVGDTAVVIAVAAPHRKDAFVACEYAIDRLKQIVPIWKKEYFEDGEVWAGWQE